jgi:hypothetical protein
MHVAGWLRGLEREEYASAFQTNCVGADQLPGRTADPLGDLGRAGDSGLRRASPQ